MNKFLKDLVPIIFLSIIFALKPVPYQEIVKSDLNKVVLVKEEDFPKNSDRNLNFDLNFKANLPNYQEALRQYERDLRQSIAEEEKLNSELTTPITVIVRSGVRYFAWNSQLRYNFHYATDLRVPVPQKLKTINLSTLNSKERVRLLQRRDILPESYVEEYARALRNHVLSPNTDEIVGTLGARLQKDGKGAMIRGYHLYSFLDNYDAFFDKNRLYITGFKLTASEKKDLFYNRNVK